MFSFYQLADQHAWQDVRIPCFKSAASPTRTVRAGGEIFCMGQDGHLGRGGQDRHLGPHLKVWDRIDI